MHFYSLDLILTTFLCGVHISYEEGEMEGKTKESC